MITLALVGAGKWGTRILAAVEKINGCQIKYLVSKSGKTLRNFPGKYIELTDYRALLNYSDIDGVIIATPGSTHFEIVKHFAVRNYFTLVEKPLTTSLKDALSIKQIAGRKPKIMVGHIYLYNPAYLVVKKLLPSIGKIRYMSFKGWNFGPFRDDMSVLWEWTPHPLSIYIDLLNCPPAYVYAWAIKPLRPDTALYDNVFIELGGNIKFFVECGWLYPVKKRELIICGSDSTILFDDLSDKKVTLFKNLGPRVIDGKIVSSPAEVINPKYEPVTPLEAEIRAFIDFIKSGKQPEANLDQAIKIARIISDAEKYLQAVP